MDQKKMLIDGLNEEELRLAIVNEKNNLLDYDFEVGLKKELKGNIYLAKVTRIEVSLQAAFVEYGRNKQGFLPFSEIVLNYFNIPEEKKQALREKELENSKSTKNSGLNAEKDDDIIEGDITVSTVEEVSVPAEAPSLQTEESVSKNNYYIDLTSSKKNEEIASEKVEATEKHVEAPVEKKETEKEYNAKIEAFSKEDENYGSRFGYKIQDVIEKNQLILIQVVKEERGNKGAFLTTNISIPGRFCVLMPYSNTHLSISKKIINSQEKQRLKSVLSELEVNKDTNIIIRTAGISKTKDEIQKDYNYLSMIWEQLQTTIKNTTTPGLIFEEGNLIKKVIRDLYYDDIKSITIEGKNTFHEVVEFAKLIAPDLVKKIKLYKDSSESLFQSHHIEEYVQNIYLPVVPLRSGGYLVIHPTEALTSIDINSGKFKGNRNIEETALKTNVEAAAEIAKQLRLRNIGGLVVVDFIDMENPRNRLIVEKKLKDEIRHDKAKIQVGQISSFGLLELARQHIKSSLIDRGFTVCTCCQGVGYTKPMELNVLQILRSINLDIHESKFQNTKLLINITSKEAFYILNHKRDYINKLEKDFNLKININYNDNIAYPFYTIEEIIESAVEESSSQTTKLVDILVKRNGEKQVTTERVSSNNNSNRPNNNPNHKPASKNRPEGFNNRNRQHGGGNNTGNRNNNRYNNQNNNSNPNNKTKKSSGWLKKLLGL